MNHSLERDDPRYKLERDADNQLRLGAHFLDVCCEPRAAFLCACSWMSGT